MSRWQPQFSDHPVHSTLGAYLEVVEATKPEEINKLEELGRLYKVLVYLREVLSSVDGEFAGGPVVASLNNINSVLSQSRASFTTYQQNGDFTQLQAANNQVDNVFSHLHAVPFVRGRAQARAIAQSAQFFEKKGQEIIDALEEQAKELASDLSDTKTRQQQTVSQINELQSTIEAQKTRLDTAINDFNTTFQNAQSARADQFEKLQQELRQKYSDFTEKEQSMVDSAIETLQHEIDDQITTYEKRADLLIDELEKKKTAASDIVQIIGNIGITGNYQLHARQEGNTANLFRWIAIGLMAFVAAGTLWIVYRARQHGFDWQHTLLKLGATLTLSAPAGYAIRESSKHRKAERQYRKTELELASLDPFLEKLPEDLRNSIKKDISERIFGQPDPVQEVDESASVTSLLGMLESVVKALITRK